MDLPSTSTGYEYDELDCKDSSNTIRDFRDKVETSENLQNFQHHELQDVTNTFASTSNIENTADKMDMVYTVQFCTSKVLMEAESCPSSANDCSEHSYCCEHSNSETQMQSDVEQLLNTLVFMKVEGSAETAIVGTMPNRHGYAVFQ
ncbi:hypothetical protein DPMN_067639 [Dreissena polymorpha]|uniref:Uncharacterized protein n=1 Tax=Dreissena polymorpha TaxID=45954 RepID=A0A9D4BVZ4_DREPO|nr:hypothetical protein DPMN_067639 [Dreissena polymorpha]